VLLRYLLRPDNRLLRLLGEPVQICHVNIAPYDKLSFADGMRLCLAHGTLRP
jgi:hypothetical protein